MMNRSWRDEILEAFVPQLAPLTLVADPDRLLADEGIQAALQALGFTLAEYQDPIAFRYFFETTIRPGWERGQPDEWVIVLSGTADALDRLPYDLLQNGRQLSLGLGNLFPHLTYQEVAALDHADLDALYRAQADFRPRYLGQNESRDFILRHVFGLDATLVKDEADLLTLLLRLHLGKQPLPLTFADRLQQQLQENGRFAEWPLENLLIDSSALFAFLQERWPLYLDKLTRDKEKPLHDASAAPTYDFQWSGPTLLPFDKPDIRAFIDTLFLEGKLRPVSHPLANQLRQLWVAVGLRHDPALDREQRLTRLLEELTTRLPTIEATHQEWSTFAAAWAEAILLFHLPIATVRKTLGQQFEQVQATIDAHFDAWLTQRYKYLSTLSPHPPVMVHHIPRSLARSVEPHSQEKVALLVMDGLAFDQWLIVRELLREQLPGVRFRESGVFTWVPTLTAVSRQALFAGKSPFFFANTISTTAKDARWWSLFWEDHGLLPAEVGYEKKLRTKRDFGKVDQLITQPKMRLVGLVVDQVDHMMHGTTLGLKGLHEQIRLWMKEGFLAGLITRLTEANYEIYLTSDHGNVAATGIGRPGEGALADLRGERVRIYPNETLRQQVLQEFGTAASWPTEGLPPDGFYPLLAPNRHAFILKDETTVTHGGHLLEEVIVPYVKVIPDPDKQQSVFDAS